MSADGPRANAAEKLLRTLDALPDHRRLSDLARATELSKSTVHRLLQEMVGEGFAAYDPESGDYTPGPRLLALSGRTLHGSDVTVGADPALRALQRSTGATVHLAVLAGDEAVYVRKLEADKPYRMVSRVGMAIPLHCTGIGKAILAAMTEAEVRAVAERTRLVGRTAATITDVDRLVHEVTAIAERGWAEDLEENEAGIVCAGAGVRDHTGRAVAAVSVSQLKSDPEAVPLARLGPQVAAAAREISTAFGAPA